MDLTITKSNVQDVDVAVNSTSVTVQQSNSLLVEVTPQQRIEINLDRTVTGNGIPSGGTTGQVLAKASNDNYDAEWETLGTMSAQNADDVAITGGSITGITDLSINDGGTGASTASDARTNLQAAKLGANTDITSLAGITGGIETADYLQLDSLATPTIGLAKLRWNADTATAAFGIVDGTDEVNIGEQMFAYVTNAESVAITRGQAVYLYQAQGNRATVKLASNLGDETSAKTLGLVAQDSIGANQTGFVITQGVVSKINTSAFAEGTTLYLGATAGSLTSTKPKAPNHLVYIGVVERANAGNGQIYVRPQNGYELDEIHDVQINSPVNGQTIIYDQSTSLWKNANLTAGTGVTIVNGNGTITISAPDNGTVTSVSGTGSVSGITLSGTVTSSGSLTLGGALDLSSPPAIGATTPSTGKFTSVTTPSVTATTNDLTLSAISTGNVVVNQGVNGATGLVLSNSALSTASARLFFQNSNGTTAISNTVGNTIEFRTSASLGVTSGVEQFRVANTASAVNYVQVTGAATGSGVEVSAQGSDANPSLTIKAKGSGSVNLGNGVTFRAFEVTASGSANYLSANSAATNVEPVLSAKGSDTNINLALQSKGTGSIDLASGSTGVNVSNGTTVTAITRTAVGTNYTSAPTIAISAPNIAGGVQATATCSIGVATFAVAGGGSGYSVNDVLTIVGGTFTTAATCTVTAVSGGVITAVSATSTGTYSVAPTNPVSVTGGTGTGATLNLTFGVLSTFTITNAGSGYTSQPTVTFSGGGGSGASAYATVGSGTVFRTLGGNVDVTTPNGIGFRVQDSGSTSSAYWTAFGTSSTPVLRAISGVSGSIGTASAVPLQFITNTSLEQFRVSHTASAVNYVQVTGAATGSLPTISAQGSDTNIGFQYNTKGFAGSHRFQLGGSEALRIEQFGSSGVANRFSVFANVAGSPPMLVATGSDTNVGFDLSTKGTGVYRFYTNTANAGTGAEQFRITHTASAVNYVQVTGNVTGQSPSVSAQGSDANIDLRLVPKGAGYSALMDGNSLTGLRVTPRATNGDTFLEVQRAVGFVDLIAGNGLSNGDIRLTPKGTGNVRFGTYTATVSSITGYIEIKDSGGTVRRLAVVA